MKLPQFLFLALFGLSISLVACQSKKDDTTPQEETTVSPEGTMAPGSTTTGDPAMNTISGSTATTGGVQHYTCPKAGCTGGAAAQGKCPICGTDLVHNQEFHNQAGANAGESPANPIQIQQPGSTPAAGDGKNAKGEYHYKCTKEGCAGGGPTQVACPICGSPTAHNQAYHN